MYKAIIPLLTFIVLSLSSVAQSVSPVMEKAISVCSELSKAIGSGTTSQLRLANKELKAAKIANFGDLRLIKGKEASLDNHFLFDEVFVDSLIVNREVTKFASRYAKLRGTRGTGPKGTIKMTTKALKAGQSAVWKTVNRLNAEYALVAEPDGLFTMTITDSDGKPLYVETCNNKKGETIRKAVLTLPDKATIIHIEVKNTGKKDSSFTLIGN